MKSALSTLRVVPLGGLGEIGMNCMAIEYQDEMLIVDCGLLFPDLEEFGIDYVIPAFDYILERREKLKAYIITHGHEDHMGALCFAFNHGLAAPVYTTEFASRLIRQRFDEWGLLDELEIKLMTPGKKVSFKHFQLEPCPVNHSIVEALAIAIDTPIGKILHTGDFKIDAEPYFGNTTDLNFFKKLGDEGVLLMLSDSTNVERHSDNPSEKTVHDNLLREFTRVQGMTIVTMFSSNVARVGQVFDIARKLGKKVVLAGRSVDQNVRFAGELKYIKKAEDIVVPIEAVDDHDRTKMIIIASGSQGEFRSALRRIAMGEHRYIRIQKGDEVLMSSRFIPGNELAINRVINELYRQGAEVLYESSHQIHTSGHASRPELERMLKAVRPKFFVPIHGEYRHLVHHGALARECGVAAKNVVVAINGSVMELSADALTVVEQREESGQLIDQSGAIVPKEVLKQRRKLAENGMVVSAFGIDFEKGRLTLGPRVHSYGILQEEDGQFLSEEAVELVEDFIKRNRGKLQPARLLEAIRIELRRYYFDQTGKRPVTIPVAIDDRHHSVRQGGKKE